MEKKLFIIMGRRNGKTAITREINAAYNRIYYKEDFIKMEKEQVKRIEELSISDAEKEKEKFELCKDCGLFPCYATAPNCYRYEEE